MGRPKMAADGTTSTVVGYRIRSGGQSCWKNLLPIALISSFNALAIIFFVKSAFVFADDSYVDGVIERCGVNRDGETADFSYLSEYLCHYLSLWKDYNGGQVYDERCCVKTLVLAGLIISGHIVAASTILLIGGFVAGKPLFFIPWLTIKALALLVFSSMAVFEVSVGSGVSSTLCIIAVITLYATLTWLVGVATYLQLRTKTAREEAEWKMRNRMDYFRFN